MKRSILYTAVFSAMLMVTGCGGGEGGSSSSNVSTPKEPTIPDVPKEPTIPIESERFALQRLTVTGINELGQDGEIQFGEPFSFSTLNRNGEQCIKDNITGLIWEKKTDDGKLRDKKWTYGWYNSKARRENSSIGGIDYTSGSCYGRQNGQLCNTETYINELNKSNYCGYNDWRMPTIHELFNLQDFNTHDQSHLPSIFDDVPEILTLDGRSIGYLSGTVAMYDEYSDSIASSGYGILANKYSPNTYQMREGFIRVVRDGN